MIAVVETNIRLSWLFILISIIAIFISAGYFILFPITSHNECPSLKIYGIIMFVTHGLNIMLWIYGSFVTFCNNHIGKTSHIFANLVLLMFIITSCLSTVIVSKCDKYDINFWNHYIEDTSTYVIVSLVGNWIITCSYIIIIIVIIWLYGCNVMRNGIKTCGDQCQLCCDKYCTQSYNDKEYNQIT